LSDIFGAKTKHGLDGNLLIFDSQVMEKLSKTDKTKIIVKELSKDNARVIMMTIKPVYVQDCPICLISDNVVNMELGIINRDRFKSSFVIAVGNGSQLIMVLKGCTLHQI